MSPQKSLKNITTRFALAALVAACAAPSAFAQTATRQQPVAATKDQAKADYKAAKSACDALSDNAKDVCREKAKGDKNVALAEIKDRKDGTEKSFYALNKARAEAEYGVAKEMCDDDKGNAKDVCVKQAKANQVAGLAAAKYIKKTDNAAVDAIKDTAKAQYKVEAEKCDALSGSAKSTCVDKAKATYKP